MPRRPLFAFVLAALAALFLAHAASAAGPRQVRITLDERVTIARLQEAGLDLIGSRHGGTIDVLEWPGDAAVIAALGARTEVVDEDPGLHAAQRARADLASRPHEPGRIVRSANRPDGVFRTDTLPAPGSGSFGGFWSLAEVKMKLDDLVASDTRNVVADKIDTLGYSVQGRPIWALKLCTPVSGTDTRPVVYYNALTHAREPGGMHAIFYFVDDLLARYPSDPVAKYLLENRQIVICPVVNPDGYTFNQRILDSTGTFGMWRKNLRDNNANLRTDTSDGVDINRNFGWKWGYDNTGSSGTASSETYRGTAAWSEPETRIQRDEFSALRPVCGLSFHTYSNLFVHPWGYTATATPDSARFYAWDDEMSLGNGFLAGQGPRILYSVNGEFSDWTYGDTLSKPKAFTWTPEVGGANDGFWPVPSRIVPIAQTVLRACWTAAGIAGPWVRVERSSIAEGHLDAGNLAHLSIRARNIGQTGQAGPGLKATLTPLDPEVGVLSGPVGYPAIGSFQSADPTAGAMFTVVAVDSITPGRMVRFRVDFSDDAGLACADTVEIVVGNPTVAFVDPCQTIGNWTLVAGSWGAKTGDATHPDVYITDSPSGLYAANATAQLKLKTQLNLTAGVHAWAFFESRYVYEQEYDGGLFEASFDSTTWTPLAGIGATTSTSTFIGGAGKPYWTGSRYAWRNDRIDLGGYTGGRATAVKVRWRTLSDSGSNFDGMSFDSLRILLYDPATQPAPVAVGSGPAPARLRLAPPAPNPARGAVAFAFETPEAGRVKLEVLDVQGRALWSRDATIARGDSGRPYASRFTWGWDLHDAAGRAVAPGLYLVRLANAHESVTTRVIVLP